MEIPISAKAFAQFIVGGPSKKSTIVRNILKPKSKEAVAITHYYSEAISVIRIFHAKENSRSYLREAREKLGEKVEKAPNAQVRAKARNNLRAIDAYMGVYGSRKRKILPRPRIYYRSGHVRISASPDLAVQEDGRLRLVKLGVKKEGDNPEVIRIMLRVIYQAGQPSLKIEPHDVVYFDITDGARIRGSHQDEDLAVTIENGREALTCPPYLVQG